MNVRSPVTGGETTTVETLSTRHVADLYERLLNIDILYLFKGLDALELRRCSDTGYEFFWPPDIAGNPDFYRTLYSQESHQEWAYKVRWEFDAVLENIRGTRRALDIGAGDGLLASRLAERFDEVVGLEPSPFGREGAKARGLTLLDETIEAHATDHAGTYDLVTAMQVLEHVSDVASFLKAATACLAPGGRLAIAVPDNDGFVGMQPDLPLNLPPHHVGRWRSASLRAVAPHFGLRVICVDHEPLSTDILGWYQSAMEKIYGPRGRIARQLYFRLGGHAMVARFLREQRHTIHGHTVMAVYERS